MWLNIINQAKLNLSELASGLLPLQYVTYGAAPWGIAGLLVYPFASAALHCSFAY